MSTNPPLNPVANALVSSTRKQNAIIYNASEVERLGNNICDEMLRLIRKQLADDDIDFTGDLSQSFHRSWDGTFKTVESNNPYGYFVENGLPAGTKVNFSALRIWVERKLGIHEGDELSFITWNIYRKIINKGISPKRFMKKAIKQFIGKHGKITVRMSKSNRSKPSGFGKLLKRVVKIIKKIIRNVKSLVKSVKSVTRTIKKTTKPIRQGIKKGRRR